MRIPILLFSLLVFAYQGYTQQMTWHQPMSVSEFGLNQSLKERKPLTNPQKATLLSAVVPGAGQIYNGKYWKAGIVYIGAAALIYTFKMNRDSMLSYQEAYRARIDGDSQTTDSKYFYLSDNSVLNYRNYHRQIRDMTILGFIGLYALQIIDANVDAHLKEFEVNDDLSFRIKPTFKINGPANHPSAGFSLFLSLH